MFNIKPMRSKDFSFATELANTMNWNMAIEDFQFMTQLEPGGCFVAFEDSKPWELLPASVMAKLGGLATLSLEKNTERRASDVYL